METGGTTIAKQWIWWCSDVVLVTQMGHRSSIKSLTFHPYGNFIATGSSDTNVKVSPHFISSVVLLYTCL